MAIVYRMGLWILKRNGRIVVLQGVLLDSFYRARDEITEVLQNAHWVRVSCHSEKTKFRVT